MSVNKVSGTFRDDSLVGSDGADSIDGAGGRDTIYGYAGNDTILAEPGYALVDGGDGDDTIVLRVDFGGTNVLVAGGAGRDTFVAPTLATDAYQLTDFTPGPGGDCIDLIPLLQNSIFFSGGNPFSAELGFIRLLSSGSDTLVQWDFDGASGAANGFRTVLTLRGLSPASITSDNFTLGLQPDGSDVRGASIVGTDGKDSLAGTVLDDTLDGAGGADQVFGDRGNDVLLGGDGNDALVGWLGNDTLLGGAGDDVLFNEEFAGSGDDLMDGGEGNDRLTSSSGNDTLRGGDGDDLLLLRGLFSSDSVVLDGGAGNDRIEYFGNGGATALISGGAGADTFSVKARLAWQANYPSVTITDFQAGAGGDIIDLIPLLRDSMDSGSLNGANPFAASAGFVRLVQDGADTRLEYDYSGAGSSGYSFKTLLTLKNVQVTELVAENFGGLPPDGSSNFFMTKTGTSGADRLLGDYFPILVQGLGGDDTLQGSSKDDTLLGGDGNDSLAASSGADSLDGGAGNDQLDGAGFNDTLLGGDGNDTLLLFGDVRESRTAVADGGAGDDVIVTAGDWWYASGETQVLATGGAGNDLFRAANPRVTLVVSDFDVAAGEQVDLGAFLNTTNFPNGFKGGNPFSVQANVMRLVQVGDDTRLEYNNERPTEQARFYPIVVFKGISAAALTAANFVGGWDPNGNPMQGRTIDGTAQADTITGSMFADTLAGGEGADSLSGSTGDDLLIGGDETGQGDTMFGGSGNDTLQGGAGNDQLYADGYSSYGASDYLYGGSGDDTLAGGVVLDGGAGNDVLRITGLSEPVQADGGDGDDCFEFYNPTNAVYNLSTESVSARGGSGADTYRMVGPGIDKTLVIEDFAADDKIDLAPLLKSIAGATGYSGGNPFSSFLSMRQEGVDVVIRHAGSDKPWIVLKNTSQAGLTAEQFMGFALDGSATPGLALQATDAGQVLTGDYLGDTLRGGAGNDTLYGNAGDDFMHGGAGANRLSGGVGNDTLVGHANDSLEGERGDDTYVVESESVQIYEGSEDKGDTLQLAFEGSYTLPTNVERGVVLAGLHGILNGNALDNLLQGNALANSLAGGAGADTLIGGGGSDTLAGGSGNDTYVLDDSADTIIETADGGDDTVIVSVSTATVADALERLFYTGTSDFTGTGNASANELRGGDGNDSLAGLSGSDTLTGNGGRDTLVGGDGHDVLNGGDGDDSLLGGASDDDLVGGAGNDWLDGGAGSDNMSGGAGDDTYVVDGEEDWKIYERSGEGNDTVLVATNSPASVSLRSNVENLIALPGAGVVYLNGNELSNLIRGSAGANFIVGRGGNDTIDGGDGNDTICATYWGSETIDGGAGTDELYLSGTLADYKFTRGDNGHIIVTGHDLSADFVGIENIRTGKELASIAQILANIPTRGNDSLTGTDAAEELDGLAGDDTMSGGKGNDRYVVDSAGDKVVELADGGIDTVITTLARYTLGGNVENLQASGAPGFTGIGNALNNRMLGTGGADRLEGLAGDDSFDVSAGSDTYIGGDGNDTLALGADGAKVFDGGAGEDTIFMMAERGNYEVKRLSLTDTLLTNTVSGDTLIVRGVEYFYMAGVKTSLAELLLGLPGAGNDSLVGSAGADTMDGFGGNDTLEGKGGNDLYLVTAAGVKIVEQDGGGIDKAEVSYAGAPYQLGDFVEEAYAVQGTLAVGISGNAQANLLKGNDGANVLQGGAGDDTLVGGLGADKLSGGTGDDVYDVDATGDYVTEAAGEGRDRVETALAKYTLGANVEDLVYTGTAAFNGTGNGEANYIKGGSGNDTLAGGIGNDTLEGRGGVDILDGGAGFDTAVMAGDRDAYKVIRTTATELMLTRTSTGEIVTLRGVEAVSFNGTVLEFSKVIENNYSPFNDYLTGTAGDDSINGANGSDTMVGGLGGDRYVVDVATDRVVELDGEGTDTVEVALSSGSYQLPDFVENGEVTKAAGILGNNLANKLTGNAMANTLLGGAGNDTLKGGAGNDRMEGGADNDDYYVDAAGDQVTEKANEGTDTVYTTLASYTLGANVENLEQTVSAAFKATGNLQDNRISVKSATSGVVDGAAGTDVLVLEGSFGDYQRARPNATDLTLTRGTQVITLRNIESVEFKDGGKTLAELQFNVQSIGNDTLEGGDGKDTMNGGAGVDELRGKGGDDLYVVDVAGDTIVEGDDALGGIDTVRVEFKSAGTYTLAANVEHGYAATGSVAISLTGNELANTLAGNAGANKLQGGGGNDALDGGAGNDTLEGGAGNDSLVGGAGSDKLAGGDGDDSYEVDVAADSISELDGGGYDRVLSKGTSYTLSAFVEELRYEGNAAFTGTGSAQANTITGSSGNDNLSGMAGDDSLAGGAGNDKLQGGDGNDTLAGGSGNDTLAGGLGNDVFVLDGGSDSIADFVSGTDLVMLRLAIGNGDSTLDNAAVRAAPNGFAANAELVVFSQNVASMSAANAALAIGSADTAYAAGDTALFALHSGSTTTLYKFTSSGADAQVSAAELTVLATLAGVPALAANDIFFNW